MVSIIEQAISMKSNVDNWFKFCRTCRYNYGHYICQHCNGGTHYENDNKNDKPKH